MAMNIPDQDLAGLQRKVDRYREVLENTVQYRRIWQESLRQQIVDNLNDVTTRTGIEARIEHRADITNLEAVIMTLGSSESGLGEPVGDLKRDLIKHGGSLVYQQLFNGKILVLINYPFIEKYGQPQPPKTVAIYRPEELKDPYLLRHLETFVTEITQWEDYDDDAPDPNQRIGFKLNFEQESPKQ
ncbi:MAG: hypothetical protein SFV52_11010 [Saprospiraceae bacterium]|nr:hypothetical protein [Saprospiraceae bacterium]